jgi:hypothetical protein
MVKSPHNQLEVRPKKANWMAFCVFVLGLCVGLFDLFERLEREADRAVLRDESNH